jgi:hypothetical protein
MASRLNYAYRRALSRDVRGEEAKLLDGLYHRHLAGYQADPKSAEEFLHIGECPLPADTNLAELAAWTSVARVVFNLHEMVTRN